MGLLRLFGIKPSPRAVAGIISKELESLLPIYHHWGYFTKLGGHFYGRGGYSDGWSAEFRFYYNGKQLAIMPCINENIIGALRNKDKREGFVNSVKQRVGAKQVDLILRGELLPGYIAENTR